MKLRTKILVPLLLLFVASIAIVVTAIVYQQSKVIRKDVEDLSMQIARTETQHLSTLLDKAYYVGDSLARTFEEYRDLEDENKREFALRALKGALASNREFMGTWACFEPNAFDGKDSRFAGKSPFTAWSDPGGGWMVHRIRLYQ